MSLHYNKTLDLFPAAFAGVCLALMTLIGCTVITQSDAPLPQVAWYWSGKAKAQRSYDCWQEWEQRHKAGTTAPWTNMCQAQIESAYVDPCGTLEREGKK